IGALVVVLSACSADALIWGPDGARVIETTERLIDAAEAGDAAAFVCPDAEVDLGDPVDWDGLSAEEPEGFVADHWVEQATLDPVWSINLSLPPDRVEAGETYPGDVFYRDSDEGLCLVSV